MTDLGSTSIFVFDKIKDRNGLTCSINTRLPKPDITVEVTPCTMSLRPYNFNSVVIGDFQVEETIVRNELFQIRDTDNVYYGNFDFFFQTNIIDYKFIKNVPKYVTMPVGFIEKYNSNVHIVTRRSGFSIATDEHTEVADNVHTYEKNTDVKYSIYESGNKSFVTDGKRMKEGVRGYKHFVYDIDYNTGQARVFREDGCCLSYYGAINNVYEPSESVLLSCIIQDYNRVTSEAILNSSTGQDTITIVTIERV